MRVFLFFIIFQLSAQETSHSRKATKIFLEAKFFVTLQDYSHAYPLLVEALSKDPEFIEAWILLGDVCVSMGDKNQGIQAYKKSILLAPRFSYPMYYRLALAEHSIGEYSDALKHIKKYMSYQSISIKFKEKASALRKSCEFSILAKKNPVAFHPINLGENINSDADEYLPALTVDGSTLIFTRSKMEQGYRNEDFYRSYHNNDQWEPSQNLGEPINT
jgi:tetratricopeptide (TPR) repeat protein